MLAHTLEQRVMEHLSILYPKHSKDTLQQQARDILATVQLDASCQNHTAEQQYKPQWDQADVCIISYGDSIIRQQQPPLQTLHEFLLQHLGNSISSVHILPFFPYTSDDGFAVLDYSSVNESLGNWSHIQAIAKDYSLMSDLVINHASSRCRWFENFIHQRSPGKDYFFTADPQEDLSKVVRPRTTPLLREVETANGTRHVWCTFSHDQVDFDFSNPEVLLAFIKILALYLQNGIKIFRLDAIAFLWKRPGSNCLHLPETHEVVKLFRTLLCHAAPGALLLTETNVPNRENLSYFGNGNEAHMIYNFSLPPLLLHTLLAGDCQHLKTWLMSMPPPPPGCTYFNFFASHDGIGLRPAEGLLSGTELEQLINTVKQFGGQVSSRKVGGHEAPYELNISLFDALQGSHKGADSWQIARFICAHSILLALEGIPAIYIHSFLATPNDQQKMQHTSSKRGINRHQWQFEQLEPLLLQAQSPQSLVSQKLRTLLAIRQQQAALHPNATQFTLQLGNALFGIWRQSQDRQQSLFSISNISDQEQLLNLHDLNLIEGDNWRDLISGQELGSIRDNMTLAPYQTVWLSNVSSPSNRSTSTP